MIWVPLTVVALLALGAVTAHVAEAAARVAGLAATVAATKAAAAVATAEATTEATLVAVASDVADLAALVALLAGSAAKATRTGSSIRALAREVVSGTAAVASLLQVSFSVGGSHGGISRTLSF